MNKESRIFVAGHTGLVGSAILRRLVQRGHENILIAPREEVDLRNLDEVMSWFGRNMPEYVFLAAAKVGGIGANSSQPVDFLNDNVRIGLNVIDACFFFNVVKLVNLGSSCIYPRDCQQPMRPEYLLTGPLEATNKSYALAKLVAIQACASYRQQYGCKFITALPTNLYGPGDRYDANVSHVVPAMILKFLTAKQSGVAPTLWGDGSPLRELMYVDDCVDALMFLADHYDGAEPVNVGSGQEHSIAEIAKLVAQTCGYVGPIVWDETKPNGTPRKLLDCSELYALGWPGPQVSFEQGLRQTVDAYTGR
jgi:GDP-L-fucose synthase